VTSKDYVTIADAIAATRPDKHLPDTQGEVLSPWWHQWCETRDAIASALKADNYGFDRDRFNEATER